MVINGPRRSQIGLHILCRMEVLNRCSGGSAGHGCHYCWTTFEIFSQVETVLAQSWALSKKANSNILAPCLKCVTVCPLKSIQLLKVVGTLKKCFQWPQNLIWHKLCSAEIIWAFATNVTQMPALRSVPGMANWGKAQGPTQNMLEGLQPSKKESAGNPTGRAAGSHWVKMNGQTGVVQLQLCSSTMGVV